MIYKTIHDIESSFVFQPYYKTVSQAYSHSYKRRKALRLGHLLDSRISLSMMIASLVTFGNKDSRNGWYVSESVHLICITRLTKEDY